MSRVEQERAELVERMADVLAAIHLHGDDLLRIPGVISVKPGYRFHNGEITDTPAVVVNVERKRDIAEMTGALVPRRLGRVIVDVIDANPLVQYRHLRSLALAGPPGPEAMPEAWRISSTLPGDEEETEGMREAALAGPLPPYEPPEIEADEVDEEMTVTCHSSCDNGSRLLKGFFARTRTSLVSTMYEFTTQHLVDALLTSLRSPRKFEFIFDGKKKKLGTGDLTRQELVAQLRKDLGKRLKFVWAANAAAKEVVTTGFFPMAYHIKVSVRDGSEVWLSSGNWKESGQPETDPQNPPAAFDVAKFLKEHNREWHLLIENQALASQFARYIRHDMKEALPFQIKGATTADTPMPDLFVPVDDDSKLGPPIFHEEMTVTKQLRVRPLFTPDKNSYFDFVAGLVSKAKKSICFENQSLAPKVRDTVYMNELFLILRDQARKLDDVRIIVRGDYSPDDILTNLQAHDFPMQRVRLLSNVHTKGLIVDGEVVVVGSHNWTGQGVRENRDASLVFWDSEIISFYQMLFDYDWSRTSPRMGPVARLAMPAEATPPGYVRVPWSDDGGDSV